MQKLVIIIISSLILHWNTQAQAQKTASLTVELLDIKKPKGSVVFALFKDAEGFPREVEKAVYKGEVNKFTTKASYTFQKIPTGTYALVVFQDKNTNGKIDANFIGMPSEPVGASNMTKLGRPTFKKCAFEITSSNQVMKIRFIND